ncbi:hypothetical protein GCM10027035_02410 [Emticicia sediminis]
MLNIQMKKTDILLVVFISVYLVLSFLFFIYIGAPDILGANKYRLYADYDKYSQVAMGGDFNLLILIGTNYFGPTLIVKLLNDNLYSMFLLNCSMLITSIYVLHKNIDCNILKLSTYLLINPILFLSLFSANKEMISLLSISFFIVFLKKRSTLMLLLTLFVSFFVRRELTTLILIGHVLTHPKFLLYSNVYRKYIIFSIILVLSILFPIWGEIIFFDTYIELFDSVNKEGSGGLSIRLLTLQENKFGYIIAVIPKIIQNLIGQLPNFQKTTDISDVYNNIVIYFQCVLFALLIIKIFYYHISRSEKKVHYSLSSNIFYFIIIYAICFSLIPIIQTRYFFPVYILLCVLDSLKKPI